MAYCPKVKHISMVKHSEDKLWSDKLCACLQLQLRLQIPVCFGDKKKSIKKKKKNLPVMH